jgi:type I restriction-modification system DNA methylase subunit
MQKPFNTAFADFKKCFEKLSYRHSYSDTFNHFLDFALWMLDPLKNREPVKYLENIYEEKDAQTMCDMFYHWSDACDNNGEGFHDLLGEMFMEFVSHGRNGQFFTPQPVCDMMANILIDTPEDGKTVSDPACGSGRLLLAAAKLNRKMNFYGADNDLTCCKMAALNLIINTMAGEIAHMNSVTMEYYRSYHIKVYNIEGKYLPFYFVSTQKAASHFFK